MREVPMKKVLVVGGAGYVGCVLVEELLAKGYSVRVLDRLFFGRDTLGSSLDRVELLTEDMRELDPSHFEGCGAVINLGGLSNDPTAEFDPRANEELNTDAAIRVAEMARAADEEPHVRPSPASISPQGVDQHAEEVLL